MSTKAHVFASALAETVVTAEDTTVSKQAKLMKVDDAGAINPELQRIVGDPDDAPVSTFVQLKPTTGYRQIPNPLSPIEGDDIFFTYFLSGAVFQSHDGQQWEIESAEFADGRAVIVNRWYPRQRANVAIDDVRRSIHSWVEPVQQVIPPPPPGVSYIAQPVRIVDGKSHL